jgi:GT2 family glycosyltransferase
MAEMPTVSVLVVNWNGAHLLPSCLAALRKQRTPPSQIVVVDNGSSDGSRQFLEAQSDVTAVFLPVNTGFAAGNNAGLRLCTGKIIALLNNDAQADEDWIQQALPAFAEPEVGMVACRVLRLEQPQIIDKAGHLMFADGLNRGRGCGRPDGPPYHTGDETLWPDGCAGFYRASMIGEIGPLDEDFFLYGEDAEWGMRAQWAGYSCRYEPQSRVLHAHSASLGKFNPHKIYFIERNRIFLAVKTFPLGMLLASPLFTFIRYGYNIRSILTGKGAAGKFARQNPPLTLAWVLARATLHGLLGLAKMWRKRGKVLRRRSAKEMGSLLRKHRISAGELTLED